MENNFCSFLLCDLEIENQKKIQIFCQCNGSFNFHLKIYNFLCFHTYVYFGSSIQWGSEYQTIVSGWWMVLIANGIQNLDFFQNFWHFFKMNKKCPISGFQRISKTWLKKCPKTRLRRNLKKLHLTL